MIEVFKREAAGRSAERKHKELTRAWRVRTFGRKTPIYMTTVVTLLLVVVTSLHLNSRWSLAAGLTLGMALIGAWLLPETLMPRHILSWQLGAWGEQMTAKELKALEHDGWAVRHDLKWGKRGNHDHVVAGAAIYVLNSKNLKDSEISIEAQAIRVTRIEDPNDGYLNDRLCPSVQREAQSLKVQLDRALGFPVYVYPVIVLWGSFAVEQQYVGEVSVVRGDKLVEWVRSRPSDLHDADKQREVADAVRDLPRA